MADIEKEAGSLYGEISSKRQNGEVAGTQRMQRGVQDSPLVKDGKRVCLEVSTY